MNKEDIDVNQVGIRYSYFSGKADVTINGEKISPYSELSSTLNRPFLESFSNIIPGLDNEIFDDYQIDFYGMLYQYKLFLTVSRKSEFCKKVRFHEIESLYSPTNLLERLSAISEQNNITVEKPVDISIYNIANSSIPKYSCLKIVNSPKADIGIFTDPNEVSSTIRIPVIIADNVSFQKSGSRVYYSIPQSEMPMFWDYIVLEFHIRPLIAEYTIALRYAKLSAIQEAEFTSIKNNTPNYYIGDIPDSLDKGTNLLIEFASFPTTAFMLKSENDNIVSCDANQITAHEGGTTFISIVNEYNEVVAQKQISVICHRYVEKIRLIPRFEYLKRSERNHIDVVITPMNAEDANQLTWKISNPNIIQVDKNGSIIALENGKATITVSGVVTSATIIVEVKPALQSLSFSQRSICLKTGETYILECNVTPSEALTDNLLWELDNKTIASINPSKTGKRCQVTASSNYEGKGNIRCYDSNTKLGAICNIEVISKVKPSKAGKVALWCWLIGIIWPFLLPVSTIAGLYGLVSDPEPDRKTKYIVCTVGSILTLLFWLMLAMG